MLWFRRFVMERGMQVVLVLLLWVLDVCLLLLMLLVVVVLWKPLKLLICVPLMMVVCQMR